MRSDFEDGARLSSLRQQYRGGGCEFLLWVVGCSLQYLLGVVGSAHVLGIYVPFFSMFAAVLLTGAQFAGSLSHYLALVPLYLVNICWPA